MRREEDKIYNSGLYFLQGRKTTETQNSIGGHVGEGQYNQCIVPLVVARS